MAGLLNMRTWFLIAMSITTLAGCGKTRGQTNLSPTANVESVRYESSVWTDPSVPAFFRNLLGKVVFAQSGGGAPTWRPVVMGKNGMVAAEHPLQALAGLRVLQSGGNAVDAAVAVFYMTAVTEPSESGLGGDGFLLAYIKSLDRVVLIHG